MQYKMLTFKYFFIIWKNKKFITNVWHLFICRINKAHGSSLNFTVIKIGRNELGHQCSVLKPPLYNISKFVSQFLSHINILIQSLLKVVSMQFSFAMRIKMCPKKMMVYKYNILINYNNLLERKEYSGIL